MKWNERDREWNKRDREPNKRGTDEGRAANMAHSV